MALAYKKGYSCGIRRGYSSVYTFLLFSFLLHSMGTAPPCIVESAVTAFCFIPTFLTWLSLGNTIDLLWLKCCTTSQSCGLHSQTIHSIPTTWRQLKWIMLKYLSRFTRPRVLFHLSVFRWPSNVIGWSGNSSAYCVQIFSDYAL